MINVILRMALLRPLLLAILCQCAFTAMGQELRLDPMFTDGMVLQQQAAVPHPARVRYLWHEAAMSTDLRNTLGLYAFPFVIKL